LTVLCKSRENPPAAAGCTWILCFSCFWLIRGEKYSFTGIRLADAFKRYYVYRIHNNYNKNRYDGTLEHKKHNNM
jgi:hypothetical protein